MWYLQDLMDASIRQTLIRWFIIFLIGLLIGFFVGCDTPYTGFLEAGDIDGYLESTGAETVCLADGFDSICIRTIPGAPGRDGKNGKDGESIIGPRGDLGPQGEPGRDGAVVYLELVKIVTEIETVEVPVLEKEIFVLHVSRTETMYHTPVGRVYVPEDAPIEVPEGVKVTPIQTSADAPKTENPKPLPTEQHPNVGDPNEIWHVAYRNDNGRLTVYVYPRERDIQTVPPLEISKDFKNEIQGIREDVNYILEIALAEENATLGTVGGVQGIVN